MTQEEQIMLARLLRQQEQEQGQQQQGPPPGAMQAGMQMMGGGSGGGGIGAAGPYAALAAAIIGNEAAAKDAGRRPEDNGEWGKDLLSGKVLETDMDYYGDKVGGVGGKMLEIGGEMGNPEGMLKNAGKLMMPWEWF